MPYTLDRGPFSRRKGVSIVESIILMIILLVAIGAIFQTVYWAQTTYAFSRQDRDSREVLFNWVETFESVWPNKDAMAEMNTPPPVDVSILRNAIQDSVEAVGNLLGTHSTLEGSLTGVARIGGFSVEVTSMEVLPDDGRIDIIVTIGTSARPFVRSLTRSYNIYTSDTVSDDSLQ